MKTTEKAYIFNLCVTGRMRLTSDIITQARAFYNPLKQRELDIRGLKIPVMENLGAAENQFDVIDLSDNSIACIENIPKVPRLHTLLLNNNLVSQITKGLGSNVPNCACLIHILASLLVVDFLMRTDKQPHWELFGAGEFEGLDKFE